jgi:2-phosphoglycerate kinase
MPKPLRGVLIAGTSHVGKSTLAARIAAARGCPVIATDKLARHPGRPWPQIPDAVAEHYTRLSPEAIYWFLRVHHENMRPRVEALIREAVTQGFFVFEGAALRPEFIAPLAFPDVLQVCLYAEPAFLRARILAESQYDQCDGAQKVWIESFLARSLTDNAALLDGARQHGFTCIDASDTAALEVLFDDATR